MISSSVNRSVPEQCMQTTPLRNLQSSIIRAGAMSPEEWELTRWWREGNQLSAGSNQFV